MNIRCAFGWHRWKELWRLLPAWRGGRLRAGMVCRGWDVIVPAGRICADCRKREGLKP
jgi:hypothetical protein